MFFCINEFNSDNCLLFKFFDLYAGLRKIKEGKPRNE